MGIATDIALLTGFGTPLWFIAFGAVEDFLRVTQTKFGFEKWLPHVESEDLHHYGGGGDSQICKTPMGWIQLFLGTVAVGLLAAAGWLQCDEIVEAIGTDKIEYFTRPELRTRVLLGWGLVYGGWFFFMPAKAYFHAGSTIAAVLSGYCNLAGWMILSDFASRKHSSTYHHMAWASGITVAVSMEFIKFTSMRAYEGGHLAGRVLSIVFFAASLTCFAIVYGSVP